MTDIRSEATRYLSLDAIRGLAVMGILAMNIVAFSMPDAAYINPLAWGGTGDLDLGVWSASFVLVDGKMRGLFSLLFGASMLLVIETADAKGEDGAALHYKRMFWLALFGLAHYFLIWFGDILFTYAVIGCVAASFRHKPTRALIGWAIGLLVLSFLVWAALGAAMLAVQHAAAPPGADPAIAGSLSGIGAPGSPEIAADLKLHGGGYGDIVVHRVKEWFMPLLFIVIGGLETLGLMLLGMALLKNGFLTGEWSAARYRRAALIGYAIGLPGMALLAWWLWRGGFDSVATFVVSFAFTPPFRIALVVAHAALAMLLIQRFADSALIRRIAAAGRAAFTNYLGTSIVMTTIFYGYGLGLYGEVSRAQAWLFVFAMWALMLLWSQAWLERFRYGPLEWLWRSLARGSAQPM